MGHKRDYSHDKTPQRGIIRTGEKEEDVVAQKRLDRSVERGEQ
jgi:hypothetical protein